MKAKKVPVRMCAGCGGRFDKRDLVRVVRTPQGDVQLDLTGKMAGRGAYVCPVSDTHLPLQTKLEVELSLVD